MKQFIKLFAITLLFAAVGCSENDQENSDQIIAKKETDVVSIEGIKYSFAFTEDNQGNITLDKGYEEEGKVITDYFEKNLSASSYYDEKEKVLHVFKNSNDMINFISKNSKQSVLKSKKSTTSKIASLPLVNVNFELLLYGNADFVNLLNPLDTEYAYFEQLNSFTYDRGFKESSILTTGSNCIVGSHTSRGFEVPNLAQFKAYKTPGSLSGSFLNIEDKISSIKLKVSPEIIAGPIAPSNFHQVTVVFFEARNFGGYSFGMSLNTHGSETYHNNLANLRMYKSWINGSKYFNDRISSYIINAN